MSEIIEDKKSARVRNRRVHMANERTFLRHKKVERPIDEDTYQPSPILDILLAMSVLAVGIFLVMYLIHGI